MTQGVHRGVSSVRAERALVSAMHMSSAAAQLAVRRARWIARSQDGVVGLRQLYTAGVPRWLVRRELRVGRWIRRGRQCLTVHNGPLAVGAQRWVALFELGPRAALDGVSVLQLLGCSSLTDPQLHVIVPRGAHRRRLTGVVRHESRRFREGDVDPAGLRQMRPAVAAVHAALWSVSERQAVFMLILAVQQRLCTVADLARALEQVRRHRWRRALLDCVSDLAGGVRSVGELDLARAMREHGLPEPERQALRRRASGTQYLDADFPAYGITVEVDGAQHDEPWARLADLERDLDLATEGRTIVRVPLLAWRVDQARVLRALERLFRSRGWAPAPVAC